MYDNPGEWARTAALVDGLNVNWAPGLKDNNRLNKTFRDAVIARFTKAQRHAYQVVPHGNGPVTPDNDWRGIFSRADAYGYNLEYLYTYSSGPGKNWQANEHELLR